MWYYKSVERSAFMETYTVTELKKNTNAVFESTRRDGYTLIIQNGKPKTMVFDIEGQDLERVILEARAMRARQSVDAMHRRSRELGSDRMGMEQIDAVIAQAREDRSCGR
jgi:hypothetical protein